MIGAYILTAMSIDFCQTINDRYELNDVTTCCPAPGTLHFFETLERYPQRTKKRNPRRATKDDEGPLRGWKRLMRDPPKVGQGEKISTKGTK